MTNIQLMEFAKYASLAFFKGLCAADLEAMAPFFTSSMYVAGTTIFNQGDRAENLCLVARGEVAIRYKPDDGPTMTVTRVQPGGVFGWSAAVGNLVYTSSAACSLDSEILCIRGEDLRQLCEKNQQIGNVLLGRLSMVIAERQMSQQKSVSSILAGGMRQGNGSGDSENGRPKS
jgi:CRP/FNR family cyclic AMP-dependent transcriptional regulator